MKNLFGFFKLTALGGLLVLLPLLLFLFLMMEMIEMVVGLASPIAGLFPADIFGDSQNSVVLAVILLAGTSFFIGLVMKSHAAKKLGAWVEGKTVNNISIYRFVKTLVSGLVDAEENANFQPALFDNKNGQKEIIYLVEDLGNGEFVALFPIAPTGFAGPVKIIAKDRILPMDASLGEVNLVLNHMGLGAGQLLKKANPQKNKRSDDRQ
jgi:uncharacterized membrane protein